MDASSLASERVDEEEEEDDHDDDGKWMNE